MTETEITIAVAKLGGWSRNSTLDYVCMTCPGNEEVKRIMYSRNNESCCEDDFQKYLTSRDAIVPVIEKLDQETFDRFWNYLRESILHTKIFVNEERRATLLATPHQLCVALLKATGNYKE